MSNVLAPQDWWRKNIDTNEKKVCDLKQFIEEKLAHDCL